MRAPIKRISITPDKEFNIFAGVFCKQLSIRCRDKKDFYGLLYRECLALRGNGYILKKWFSIPSILDFYGYIRPIFFHIPKLNILMKDLRIIWV